MDFRTKMIKFLILVFCLSSEMVIAGNKEKAYRLFSRLNSTPPSQEKLNQVIQLIAQNKNKEAALLIMNEENFYNISLKNWIKSWANVERTPRVPLNDYVATVVGIIRDDIPFDQVLYGDHLYIATNTPTNITIAPYSKANNTHYEDLERNRLSLKTYLTKVSQSATTGIQATAGVITTRAAASAFFSAGTNRRMTRFLFINYLCRDFEAVHDTNVPDYWVRRDVERNPGGDSRAYKNQCVGCHAGQDSIGGAWAYYDFVNGELRYTPGEVVSKINKNVHFEQHEVVDDSWENMWAQGQNSNLGWPSVTSGKGARELGMMLSRTRAFSECMAQRSYEKFCLKKSLTSDEKNKIRALADSFQKNANYNMKNLIAETSILCLGE